MAIQFDDSALLAALHAMDDKQLDGLEFGVIAFDAETLVTRYNLHETLSTGLKRERVLGNPLFTDIAQCMNNFMVAQKYQDAQDSAAALDETIHFVLTWRMRPTPVRLRLLAAPEIALQYLALQRAV
jgi:photoactive yellow protein